MDITSPVRIKIIAIAVTVSIRVNAEEDLVFMLWKVTL
jgi:hypothetical protein